MFILATQLFLGLMDIFPGFFVLGHYADEHPGEQMNDNETFLHFCFIFWLKKKLVGQSKAERTKTHMLPKKVMLTVC